MSAQTWRLHDLHSRSNRHGFAGICIVVHKQCQHVLSVECPRPLRVDSVVFRSVRVPHLNATMAASLQVTLNEIAEFAAP